METEPDIPSPRLAAFVRQCTHDFGNVLNNLDLEAALLQEMLNEKEALAGTERVRKLVRNLADRLASLRARFREAEPIAAPIAARELLLIWREQHATLPEAPEVHWVDELGNARVNVDVEMMVGIFRELLANAAAFSQGGPVAIVAREEDKSVTFEVREPKTETLDPCGWGQVFSTMRQDHYSLGLWAARRLARANGAILEQSYAPEEHLLITRFSLAVI